jgi:hypothetical protein
MRGACGIRFDDRYRTVCENRIIDMLVLGGFAYERDGHDARSAAGAALRTWVQMGVGTRLDAGGERRYDPVEVVNFLKQAGLAGADDFWADRYVRTGRRLVGDLAADSRTRFYINLQRTFYLEHVATGRPLRLRAPLPLASAHGSALEISACVTDAKDARLTLDAGRIEVRTKASGLLELTVEVRIILEAGAARADGVSPRHLEAREGLIVVTDRICALARRLAG